MKKCPKDKEEYYMQVIFKYQRFKIISVLSTSKFAETFIVKDSENMNLALIMKKIPQNMLFKNREYDLLSELKHPHILKFIHSYTLTTHDSLDFYLVFH